MPNLDVDAHDRFLQSVNEFTDYPYNLLRAKDGLIPTVELDGHKEALDNAQNAGDLFHGQLHRILFLEQWSGTQEYQSTEIGGLDQLKGHLFQQSGTDPRCRYILIEAEDSKAPLNCSQEMFTKVLSYHEVGPHFIDSAIRFGDRNDDSLGDHAEFHPGIPTHGMASYSQREPLPSLGRSGNEIRHSISLQSVERCQDTESAWSRCQIAVDHSFDIETERMSWIILNNSNSLRSMIVDNCRAPPTPQSDVGNDVARAFARSLRTILLLFKWCGKGWEAYQTDIHTRANSLNRDAEDFQRNSQAHIGQQFATGTGRQTGSAYLESGRQLDHELNTLGSTWGLRSMYIRNFDKLIEDLERARLNVKLNRDAMHGLMKYYDHLATNDDISPSLRSIKDPVSRFSQQGEEIIRDFVKTEMLLDYEQSKAEGRKTQFIQRVDNQVTYRSQRFDTHNHQVALATQGIAEETESKTWSSHCMAAVALIFIPATFFATFFQSGILYFDESSGNLKLHKGPWSLFAVLCFPITVFIIVCCVLVNWWKRRRSRDRLFPPQDASFDI